MHENYLQHCCCGNHHTTNMTSQLPQELILKILWDLSLKDCRSFLVATESDKDNKIFDPAIVTCALLNRESPNLYLGHFFPNPSELLSRMKMYNVWIVGSLVLNYFSGNVSDKPSKITFLVPSDLTMIMNFMEYMRIMGVKWLPSPSDFVFVNGSFQYRNSTISIELNTKHCGIRNMIDSIITQELSILQCAITGHSVFHMYANDVYDKQSSIWAYEHNCSFTYMPSKQMIRKYINLGYKFVKGSRHLPNYATLKQNNVSRTIGDINSELMNFDHFGEWESEPAKHEMKVIEEYRWNEYPSFLRYVPEEYDHIDTQLFILRNHVWKYFNELRESTNSQIVDVSDDDYSELEKSILTIGKLSVKDEHIYDSIDQDYYNQIGVICYLRDH